MVYAIGSSTGAFCPPRPHLWLLAMLTPLAKFQWPDPTMLAMLIYSAPFRARHTQGAHCPGLEVDGAFPRLASSLSGSLSVPLSSDLPSSLGVQSSGTGFPHRFSCRHSPVNLLGVSAGCLALLALEVHPVLSFSCLTSPSRPTYSTQRS